MSIMQPLHYLLIAIQQKHFLHFSHTPIWIGIRKILAEVHCADIMIEGHCGFMETIISNCAIRITHICISYPLIGTDPNENSDSFLESYINIYGAYL